jgi:hypothetical protein
MRGLRFAGSESTAYISRRGDDVDGAHVIPRTRVIRASTGAHHQGRLPSADGAPKVAAICREVIDGRGFLAPWPQVERWSIRE